MGEDHTRRWVSKPKGDFRIQGVFLSKIINFYQFFDQKSKISPKIEQFFGIFQKAGGVRGAEGATIAGYGFERQTAV